MVREHHLHAVELKSGFAPCLIETLALTLDQGPKQEVVDYADGSLP